MDVVSHGLFSALLAAPSHLSRRARAAVVVAGMAPDAATIPVYLLLGREQGRPLWIPTHEDWHGVREAHPVWSALWEIPHGVPFLLVVVLPLVAILRLPRLAFVAYAAHLGLDLLTHTGEWAVRPFYPWGPLVQGFTDAWRWPLWAMASSWAVLVGAILLVRRRGS